MSTDAMEGSTKIFTTPRLVTLLGSVLVTLSSGTNYAFSAYAPQLGSRLRVSNTQLNVIGLAGNMGVYIFGPIWGRVVDHKGPRIPLICASISLLLGYLGIKKLYDDGTGDASTLDTARFVLLVLCGFTVGGGSNGGIAAAANTTAKSFPPSYNATALGIVTSGLGLSAFMYSSLGQLFFSGDTSSFLLLLAVGAATSMLVGLFTVKPVPPETQVISRAETDAESAPLLSHEPRSYQASSSNVEAYNGGYKDAMPNIHGRQLWCTPDFYLLFALMGLCCGTAIMYINNVGSISRALYAAAHPIYNEAEASRWQATQVSIVSLGNFAGRILIGILSDFVYTRLGLPRAYCFCLVTFLFVLSQATAIAVNTVEMLWIASMLLGLAYGALFGSFPTTLIEWFGLAHFSENWGYLSFAPAIGGNLFSLLFGRNLDGHAAPAQGVTGLKAAMEDALERQCFDGKACYVASLQVTLVACIISFGLSWWAGVRDGRKRRRV